VSSISGICREYKWKLDYVIHELPMSQAFAFSSCSAWAGGMIPKNGGYTDWELEREITRLENQV
jgi:hypothetical protein